MAVTKINGNQISNTTSAIISTLSFLNTTSVLQLPTGTTAQRPTGVTYGTIRFNTTLDNPEVFKSNSDGSRYRWMVIDRCRWTSCRFKRYFLY